MTDFVQHQLFRPYIIKSCIEEEDENSVWQWRAESFLAWQWQLPAAGRDGTWTVRTVSRLMWMCGDIFAAQQLWRGLLLTTGHLSSLHPVVVGWVLGVGDCVGGAGGGMGRPPGDARRQLCAGLCECLCLVLQFSSVGVGTVWGWWFFSRIWVE